MNTFYIGVLSTLGILASLFLIWRRGSKQPENSELSDSKEYVATVLNDEEMDDVVETTYEILEEEHLQDEEFENKVVKIKTDIEDMSNPDLADFANSLFGDSPADHPITCTDDKSKFEWERDGDTD